MRIKRLLLALAMLAVITASAGAYFFSAGSGDDEAVGDVAQSPVAEVPQAPVDEPLLPVGDALGTVNEEPQAAVSSAPARKDAGAGSKTQSALKELAVIQESGGTAAAEEFAARRGLKLVDGSVQLVIEAADAAAAARDVTAAGGVVETTSDKLVQASVPVGHIDDLSSSPAIAYIREPQTPAISAISEGVADIGAGTWHGAGSSGAGVKVAIIDLGFQGYQGLSAAGELPANVTTASFRTDGDITGGGEAHGSACAEVVYDIAPGAQFYLVNFSTDVELANAIDYIIAQDIDVVSASWSFFGNFRGDGQGSINAMVQNAHDSGVFWANVAGNAAQDHWSGSFSDTNNDSWHEFAAGDDGNDLNVAAGTTINAYLTWDKWPVTDQDYDMYLIYEGNPNAAVASSDGYQGGTQAPSEQIHYTVPPGRGGRYWITIYNYSATGDATFKLYTYPLHLEYRTSEGSLAGQPTDSPYAMTVGAVQVNTIALELFSSRGPTVDGRIKPDIVGPDRITTSTYGSTGFWGTSASAPHVAGAGALVAEAYPAYTPAQIRSFLEARATDLGVPGKDNLYGSGKLSLGALPDIVPPVVTDVQPAGEIDTTDTVISAAYSDSGGGIDTGAVEVMLDGNILSGCVVTATSVSCNVSGLAGGEHIIGGSVADINGNSTPINGSFTVTCYQPVLSLGSAQPFWASYQDYLSRELSITYSLCNIGANDAYGVTAVGSTNTSGVVFISGVPVAIGDLSRGDSLPVCGDVTFKYLVPFGVESFKSTTYMTADGPCGASYAYPGPYINPGG